MPKKRKWTIDEINELSTLFDSDAWKETISLFSDAATTLDTKMQRFEELANTIAQELPNTKIAQVMTAVSGIKDTHLMNQAAQALYLNMQQLDGKIDKHTLQTLTAHNDFKSMINAGSLWEQFVEHAQDAYDKASDTIRYTIDKVQETAAHFGTKMAAAAEAICTPLVKNATNFVNFCSKSIEKTGQHMSELAQSAKKVLSNIAEQAKTTGKIAVKSIQKEASELSAGFWNGYASVMTFFRDDYQKIAQKENQYAKTCKEIGRVASGFTDLVAKDLSGIKDSVTTAISKKMNNPSMINPKYQMEIIKEMRQNVTLTAQEARDNVTQRFNENIQAMEDYEKHVNPELSKPAKFISGIFNKLSDTFSKMAKVDMSAAKAYNERLINGEAKESKHAAKKQQVEAEIQDLRDSR